LELGFTPDFNTMVNRTITTTKNKHDEMRDKKRKFKAKKTYSQEKTMKLQQQGLIPSSYCVIPTTLPPSL
jgi:hypothetical protein